MLCIYDLFLVLLLQLRKVLLIVDSAAFGSYALLWFITFVYMAAEWGEVTDYEKDEFVKVQGGKVSTIQAAIAFSFFAILIWVSCMYVHRYMHTHTHTYTHIHTLYFLFCKM